MIYGIDPGSYESAIVAFDGRKIHFASIMENGALINLLRRSKSLTGQRLVIELIGHYGTGMPAGRDVFDTCIMIGQIKEAAQANGAIVSLVLRATIKIHLCRSSKASDANVSQALKDKYGEKGTKANPGFFFGFKDDLWSAMAVADYALTHPIN